MAPTPAPDPQLAALFSASVDDIWRLDHPPPTPAMVRLAAEARAQASQQRAAAAGGGGGGVHAAVSSAGRVRRASLRDQPGAPALRPHLPRAVRADGPALGARVPARWPRFGVTHWFMPGHAGANASRASLVPAAAAAGGPSALFVVRSPVGWARDVRTTSPQPAAARHELPRFSTTAVAVVRGCRPHVARRAAACDGHRAGAFAARPSLREAPADARASRQAAAQRGHQVRGAGRAPGADDLASGRPAQAQLAAQGVQHDGSALPQRRARHDEQGRRRRRSHRGESHAAGAARGRAMVQGSERGGAPRVLQRD